MAAILVGVAFAPSGGYAQSTPDVRTFWIGTLAQPNKTVVAPLLFTSEQDCRSTLAQINAVTQSTIKQSNQQMCSAVLINTTQLKAYVATQ